jgi:hypothetical protein
MKKLLFFLTMSLSLMLTSRAQIKNFDAQGKQLTRFDQLGNAVDAHDGEIALFNGTYYLYGTSYDCGFEWNNKSAPFCGFKSYSSKDMITWKDEGFLFDAQNPLWQTRCDGKTYGCFRPHVIFNEKNKTYVLWINVYDNVSGYRVFTSKNATGPFVEVAEPKIAVNSTMPAGGLNNGDHDLFIDDDGTGYIAFTDWRTKGSIVIEQLTGDYLSGTGKVSAAVTGGKTEAPALFKRKGVYYVTYSDPNCGYCSGTGTSYKTADSPLGPWSVGKRISDNSCGGQPSFVSTIKTGTDTLYLYGSDLWNNAAKNEAQANFYWAALTFAADGSINPLQCLSNYAVKKNTGTAVPEFTAGCDITAEKQRSQIFTANISGTLETFGITTLKSGYPDQALNLDFYEFNEQKKAPGTLIRRISIPADTIGWSARVITIKPAFKVRKGKRYLVVLRSSTTKGCYGFAIGPQLQFPRDHTSVSEDGGKTFKVQPARQLKYSFSVR